MTSRAAYLILALTLSLTFAGCAHRRVVCVAKLPDMGERIATKNRYAPASGKVDSLGNVVVGIDEKECDRLKSLYPEVFDRKGYCLSCVIIIWEERIDHMAGQVDSRMRRLCLHSPCAVQRSDMMV